MNPLALGSARGFRKAVGGAWISGGTELAAGHHQAGSLTKEPRAGHPASRFTGTLSFTATDLPTLGSAPVRRTNGMVTLRAT